MPTLPTNEDYAVSALLNGLESGLDLTELSDIWHGADDGRDFDVKVSQEIEARGL